MAERTPHELANEIYTCVGRALSAFSFVEFQLCRVFAVAVRNAYSDQADSAYWTITSFDARVKMVSAAIRSRHKKSPALLREWDDLRAKLLTQNTTRNKIAHGTVIRVEFSTRRNPQERTETFFAPYYWGREGGRETPVQRDDKKNISWHDPRPKERLSAKRIDEHKEDFMAHAALLNAFAEKMRLEARRKAAQWSASGGGR